jgi:AcrR family transcriptional regulator
VRIRDADATRTALIAAARELFACDGFDRTTVRGIADRAGVNQALLFRYFGNKEGLFAEAIRDELARAYIAAGGPSPAQPDLTRAEGAHGAATRSSHSAHSRSRSAGLSRVHRT